MEIKEKTYTCIVCPRSCRITVKEETQPGEKLTAEERKQALVITGNSCRRGEEYARNEHVDPRRTLTSTVCIEGARIRRLPVVTSTAVPKAKLAEVQEIIGNLRIAAPVTCGQILVKQAAGTEADLIAARSVEAE